MHFIILSILFVSAIATLTTIHDEGFFQKLPQGKSSLRKIPNQEVVNMTGYYETVAYGHDGCKFAGIKRTLAIQSCGKLSSNSNYLVNTIYSDRTANTYSWFAQYFTDPACEAPVADPFFVQSTGILSCNSDNCLYHVIPEPLNPEWDDLGMSLLLYNSESTCTTNNYASGVLESAYYRLNVCIGSDGLSDVMYTSCDSSSLTVVTFSTTDGTCTGTRIERVLTSSNSCFESKNSLNTNSWIYNGWVNFGCSASVKYDQRKGKMG